MRGFKARERGRSLLSQLLLIVSFLIFLTGGCYFAYVFYSTVKEVVAHAQLPSLPNLYLPIPGKGGARGMVIMAEVPKWEEKERVNILLLGIDKRPVEEGPWRTDTMILATIDPTSKTAGLLSIPRDLWVTVPGYDENRINTAHYTGDLEDYPGGGPALAKKTVQYNLGVPVHCYIRIDFDGFRKIIDTIGGIDIDVKEPIKDEKYPDENYGYDPLYIPAGLQHMDGDLALKYARTRHGGSDFERAKRQQEVLFAIREQALRLNLLPKIPELMVTLADTVQTDFQPSDILTLAQIASQIDPKDIRTSVIDESKTVRHITPTGADVLLPIRDEIRPLIDEMFTSPPPTVQMTTVPVVVPSEIVEEAARIVIQNGTTRAELAAQTANFLKKRGYQVEGFSNADRFDYQKTIIIDYTGKSSTIGHLAQMFKVSPEDIRRSPNLKSDVDIRLILGEDFQLPESGYMGLGDDVSLQLLP